MKPFNTNIFEIPNFWFKVNIYMEMSFFFRYFYVIVQCGQLFGKLEKLQVLGFVEDLNEINFRKWEFKWEEKENLNESRLWLVLFVGLRSYAPFTYFFPYSALATNTIPTVLCKDSDLSQGATKVMNWTIFLLFL